MTEKQKPRSSRRPDAKINRLLAAIEEAHETVRLLAAKLAQKNEIIRRLID